MSVMGDFEGSLLYRRTGRTHTYQDLDPLLLYRSLVISGVAYSHQSVHLKLLQLLGKTTKREREEREESGVSALPNVGHNRG